jgi:hypothetical protein
VRLASARLPKNPRSKSSFWRFPCPPIPPTIVPLCVLSRFPTAANAACPVASAIPTSAPSMPARKRKPSTARLPRSGYCLSPLRQLSLRLRSQFRPRTPLLRRRPRPGQTQNRLHLGLSRPNSRPNLHLAQHEYINAYGTDFWRETVRTSLEQSTDHISPDTQSATTTPESASAAARKSPLNPSLADESD